MNNPIDNVNLFNGTNDNENVTNRMQKSIDTVEEINCTFQGEFAKTIRKNFSNQQSVNRNTTLPTKVCNSEMIDLQHAEVENLKSSCINAIEPIAINNFYQNDCKGNLIDNSTNFTVNINNMVTEKEQKSEREVIDVAELNTFQVHDGSVNGYKMKEFQAAYNLAAKNDAMSIGHNTVNMEQVQLHKMENGKIKLTSQNGIELGVLHDLSKAEYPNVLNMNQLKIINGNLIWYQHENKNFNEISENDTEYIDVINIDDETMEPIDEATKESNNNDEVEFVFSKGKKMQCKNLNELEQIQQNLQILNNKENQIFDSSNTVYVNIPNMKQMPYHDYNNGNLFWLQQATKNLNDTSENDAEYIDVTSIDDATIMPIQQKFEIPSSDVNMKEVMMSNLEKQLSLVANDVMQTTESKYCSKLVTDEFDKMNMQQNKQSSENSNEINDVKMQQTYLLTNAQEAVKTVDSVNEMQSNNDNVNFNEMQTDVYNGNPLIIAYIDKDNTYYSSNSTNEVQNFNANTNDNVSDNYDNDASKINEQIANELSAIAVDQSLQLNNIQDTIFIPNGSNMITMTYDENLNMEYINAMCRNLIKEAMVAQYGFDPIEQEKKLISFTKSIKTIKKESEMELDIVKDDNISREVQFAIFESEKEPSANENLLRICRENKLRYDRIINDDHKLPIIKKLSKTMMKSKKITKNNEMNCENMCTLCNRKFVHASGLSRHMEKHTMDLGYNANKNCDALEFVTSWRSVIVCNYCGLLQYNTKNALEHFFKGHCYNFEDEPELVHEEAEKDNKVTEENNINIEQVNDLEMILKMALEEIKKKQSEEKDHTVHVDEIYMKEFNEVIFKTVAVNRVLQCEFCDYTFADIDHLMLHTSKHVIWRKYYCNACGITTSNYKEMLNHWQVYCVYLRESLIRNECNVQRLFACNVCKKTFRSIMQLQEHRYTVVHLFPRWHKFHERYEHLCEQCNYFSTNAKEAVEHYKSNHGLIKKPYKIENNTKRMYLCEVCGKSYTQSSHLWQHLRFHNGVKPFACEIDGCDRKFTIRPDLQDHIRKHHTFERPYQCIICNKRFLTGSVYYQHRLIHRDERRYECDDCHKRFYRADALKNHQRIHTGEKPFSCQYCTKSFRQRGDRDKHLKARHGYLDDNELNMLKRQKEHFAAIATNQTAVENNSSINDIAKFVATASANVIATISPIVNGQNEMQIFNGNNSVNKSNAVAFNADTIRGHHCANNTNNVFLVGGIDY